MKAAYTKAERQIEIDKIEILQIDETLKTLYSKYEPMVSLMNERKAQMAMLKTEFKKANDFMTVSLKTQQNDLQKVLHARQRMAKTEASQKLKEQRGFGMAPSSTYTNAKMLEDEWAKALGEVPFDVKKKAKAKVMYDTVPVALGGGVIDTIPGAGTTPRKASPRPLKS
jgi:hypothetical protein